ncbi:N-acetylmuramoyl-L-alanine amidase [Ponticoccus gilvus]|nr:N-acetylmuramoyl-L-alanine amidase [Enemella evansiae]
MRIVDHKLEGAPFLAAHFTGGVITPEIVVLHDTAGRLERGNSARYLASANTGKASVHFVVERDGAIYQLVDTNRRANHAGTSSFNGRPWCNSFSIGIEIVNPGKMTSVRGFTGRGRAWYGQVFDEAQGYELETLSTPDHGSGVWMAYTEPQLEATIQLLEALFDGVPTLRDITTHWYVSPGRKVDTNPLFPLDHIRARILGRDDPADAEAENGSEPVDGEMVQVDTLGGNLNHRRWPSFNPNVIGTIPDGTVLPVLRTGTFGGRDWLCVLWDGREGWIVARYAAHLANPDL